MALTVNIYYSGINGDTRKFAEEMLSSGRVERYITDENGVTDRDKAFIK